MDAELNINENKIFSTFFYQRDYKMDAKLTDIFSVLYLLFITLSSQ